MSKQAVHQKLYNVPVLTPRTAPGYELIKRVLDILLSFLALLLLLVPGLVISLWILLDSPGHVIYRQERLGKNGKPFTLYKFRSMQANAEEDGAQWAREDDERCTRIGRFLRKSRLDEIPQFVNILAGDMSLVGPRPERECFYRLFEENIHGFSQRLLVKPGLTGWAQVNGGYDLLPEEKIVYDAEYIENRSLLLDCRCVFRTIAVLFNHHGAR